MADRKLTKLTARMLGAMNEEELVAAWRMARRLQPEGMLPTDNFAGAGRLIETRARSSWDVPEDEPEQSSWST